MKTKINYAQREGVQKASSEEILILTDGRILTHNLTRDMAAVLQPLNPHDEPMRQRAAAATKQLRPRRRAGISKGK